MEDFTGKRVRIRTLEKLGSGCRLNGLTATVVAQHPIAPDWLKIELDPNSVTSHGETDDFSYNVISDPVHVHDIQATILRCLGIDHKRLTSSSRVGISV